MRHEQVVIVGAGPAGLTAAIYTARSGLETLVIEKLQPGGMMASTDIIENYPGYEEGINGPELSMKMQQQAERFGARFEFGEVHGLTTNGDKKILQTDLGEIEADVVIGATGTEHRMLGVPGERELFGKGVSICGTCDGPFYKGKEVAVVGGGNSALQEAMFIARFAEKVHIVHRRDELRADKILADRAMNTPNIRLVWDSIVTEVVGENGVDGVRLKNKKTGEESLLAVDGFFIFIGLIPNNAWLGGALPVDEQGFIVTDIYGRTDLPGVFMAGDLRSKDMRQIATAVGDGAMVARVVEDYLDELAETKPSA
ncbi:MAG: thioredoxin-disulfide reductase [Candidatus Lernaella stagnicola]|nr:thioredoxin-disulfide reductase [Candidatus Lernaella stagnicola]